MKDGLIHELVAELKPVKPLKAPFIRAGIWSFSGLAAILLVTALVFPLKKTLVSDLIANPRFALEVLMGIMTFFVAAVVVLRNSIPGSGLGKAGYALVGGVLTAWVLLLAYSYVVPAQAISAAGKRPQCILETFLYSVPPGLALIAMLRFGLVTEKVWAGFLVGVAAAAIPATIMNATCAYMIPHIFLAHMLPAAAVVIVCILIAWIGFRS